MNQQSTSAKEQPTVLWGMVSQQYLLPFILIASLFLLWGGARSILDVLNKHLQQVLHVSKAESADIQLVVYLAYFVGALPAGMAIRRLGTRIGVMTGLMLFATGSFLFLPTIEMGQFSWLLLPLFVIGLGLVLLETAANPYVTLLGHERTAPSRLNVAQSLNGLGSMLGALFAGMLFFGENADAGVGTVAVPYTVLAVLMLIVAACFAFTKLPDASALLSQQGEDGEHSGGLGLTFFFGLLALISYEISEISINTFFINFMTDDGFLTPSEATVALSMGGLLLFMLGRIGGGVLMARISAPRVFLVSAIGATVCMLLAMSPLGALSRMAVVVCYVFESIMFPTIFAMSLSDAGERKQLGASVLMMSVIGGAIGPKLMGLVADHYGMTLSMSVPLAGFAIVLLYAAYKYMRN